MLQEPPIPWERCREGAEREKPEFLRIIFTQFEGEGDAKKNKECVCCILLRFFPPPLVYFFFSQW